MRMFLSVVSVLTAGVLYYCLAERKQTQAQPVS